jgi:hypothetical protein
MRQSSIKCICVIAGVFAAGNSANLQAQNMQVTEPVLLDNPAPLIAAPSVVSAKPQKSLLFTPEEIASIRAALGAIGTSRANGEALPDFIQSLTGENSENVAIERSFTYPVFFLSSLVYRSPEDWVVRINQQNFYKISALSSEEVSIVSIDHKKVRVRWRPADLAKIMPKWSSKTSKTVSFDAKDGVFEFTLQVNQTFSSHAMEVVEGKLLPITEAISAIPESSAQSSELPSQPVVEPQEQHEGLQGLIGAYKDLEKTDQEPMPGEKR